MDIHFEGRTVIVTGAGRGIGRAIVQGFSETGAAVWATDVNEAALAELAGATRPARGGRLSTRRVDVTRAEELAALARDAEAAAEHGAVDVLVHVAGGVLGQAQRPIEEVASEDWSAIMAVNATGGFNAAKAVVPGMKRARRGAIVVIASRAGLAPSLTGIQAYCAAKHAEVGLTRQLAHELGPFGIRVNAIAPGFMPTSPDYVRQWDSYGEAGQTALVERTAMRRLGRPEDIAHAALFLASDFAGYVTGQVLQVTGSP